jgi:hypothetical protein
MVFSSLSLEVQTQTSPVIAATPTSPKVIKKTDVAEHPEVIDHVGLRFNEPPAVAGCSSSSHPTST